MLSHSSNNEKEALSATDSEQQEESLSSLGQERPRTVLSRLILPSWILLNVLATIAIVFVNKAIFDTPSLRRCQLLFAALHLLLTWSILHICSTRRFRLFKRKTASLRELFPIASAMCLNVVLPNLSLAYSGVTFYQTARVLLTPVTALINYVLRGQQLSSRTIPTLVPVCLGVAVLIWFETRPTQQSKSTTPAGIFFAMAGVFSSSLYTVWIGYYTNKLGMTSVELLHCQALLGSIVLLHICPWIDHLPEWGMVPGNAWILVLLSGICACLINVSQFIIISRAGPVGSTLVGHVKTIAIVTLGWVTSRKHVSDGSLYGVVTAIGGILLYSVAQHGNSRQ